jgi:hypothetical protein
MAKSDTAASYDAERAEQLAERCAALLKPLPSRHDPHRYRPRLIGPGELQAEIKSAISRYFAVTRYFAVRSISRQPDDESKKRKDYDDMRKAAIKLADRIRRFGVRNLDQEVDLDNPDNDPPDLEALLVKLESMTMWMEKHAPKHLWPSLRNKGLARAFVTNVIAIVEMHTGRPIKRDTKGTPTAEFTVMQQIVTTVDPTIGPGTITEALKYVAKSGSDWSGSRPWPPKGVTVDWFDLPPDQW